VKLDAVPGMTGKIWFTPTQTGTYEVVCAELCGAEHWKMRALLTVDTPEAYEKWLDEIKVYTQDKPK
jgi:cytochrome c oxidase subunit II